jgi:hypothetical protein
MRSLLLAAALLVLPVIALAQVWVNPYVRRDGATVPGHYRSQPDGIRENNYSYPGNTNPYTGRVAPGNANTSMQQRYFGGDSPYRPYGR